MVARIFTLSLFIAASCVAYSQAEPGPAAPAPSGDEAAAPSAPAPEPEQPVGPPGDLVTLKNGHVYRGLQVVKSTSAEIVLEVIPEVMINIPRRQIVSIEFDDIDPNVERAKRQAAESAVQAATTALFPAQKVPENIQSKLRADISTPPIKYDKRDLIEAVGELNMLPAVQGLLELDRPVTNLKAEQRQWTFESTPGMSLAALLEAMKKSVPSLATVIRDGKLLITDEKTAREILSAQTPPPAADAPPPSAPAAP